MASAEPRTLLLFCPYDKKVTRHARRGPKLQMVCMDCGRAVEVDRDEPAMVRAPRASQPERTLGSPPEIPDLAEILAAPLPALSPMRSRRGSSTRAGPGGPSARGRKEVRRFESVGLSPSIPPRRSGHPREAGRPKVHPALIIAAAFFAVLALANVVGNLLGGPRDEPGTATEAVFSGRIFNTDGQGVYIRRSPSLDDRLPNTILDGVPIRVIGPESVVQGSRWRQIENLDGIRGWVPAQYVAID